MTPKEKAQAGSNALLDAMAERLAYLAGRWHDEKEHEAWGDYGDAMRNAMPAGYTMVGTAKRPFGCKIKRDGVLYSLTATASGRVSCSAVASS